MNLSAVRGIGLVFLLSSQLALAFQKEPRLVLDRPEETGYTGTVVTQPAVSTSRVVKDAGPRSAGAATTDVRVEMEIDSRGIPFSVKAAAGLPDDVVRSMTRWTFEPAKKNGRYSSFDVVMIVPVTTSSANAPRSSAARTASEEAPRKLKQADAAAIEKAFFAGEQPWTSVLPLLKYAVEGDDITPDEARRIRARYLPPLVEGHPDEPILNGPHAVIHSGGRLADPVAYQELRIQWLKQLAQPSVTTTVLKHAVNFLRFSDPDLCERRLLAELHASDGPAQWLGELYAMALLGVTEFDPRTGVPAAAGASLPRDGFGKRALEAIRSTPSGPVLRAAMQSLMTSAHALAAAGKLPAGYASACEPIFARMKQHFPTIPATCDPLVAVPEVETMHTNVNVGGRVQSASVVKNVAPKYPAEARDRGIQGSVRFNVTIGTDGRVRQLSLVSGPLALYESAYDALSQRVYKPALLNNRPIEVQTVIDVDFSLSR